MQTFRLVDRVSASWRRFGLILGLTGNQLDVLADQYRGDSNMCWAKVMECWLSGSCKRDDYPVTWEGVYTLLNDAEYSVIAEELRMAVDRASTDGAAAGEDNDADDDDDIIALDTDHFSELSLCKQ